MKLQTQIPLEKQSKNLIDYKSNVFMVGSCFVEHIGDKLDYFKFKNFQNPLGILFHPQAIETLIGNAVKEKEYAEHDVFFHNEQWHCFDAHSSLSHVSKEKLISRLNNEMTLTVKQITESTHIIITLGTSWVYRFLENNNIVANCHKIPQKQFKKELLSVDDVFESLKKITSLIKQVNSKAKIIFTVSPIRHLKDGFIENTQSKAHLITAIHKLLNQKSSIENRQSFYFPAYEIMMDELRDYRFYKDDMIHPNQTAVNYIWEKFKQVWILEESNETMKLVDEIQKGLLHKPFNPNSKAHQKFLKSIETKKEVLKVKISNISF